MLITSDRIGDAVQAMDADLSDEMVLSSLNSHVVCRWMVRLRRVRALLE